MLRGATRRVVLRVALLEGLALAGATMALAGVLAIPLSIVVCRAVGSFGLHADVPLVVSLETFALWVALAVLVATLACVGPACAAPRGPHVLAHE